MKVTFSLINLVLCSVCIVFSLVSNDGEWAPWLSAVCGWFMVVLKESEE